MNYLERLETLNADTDTRSVLESIDRPIRELVLELNRVGLKTMWSCCGFQYDGEEEPKSHCDHPFVVVLTPTSPEEIKTFFEVSLIAFNSGWECHRYSEAQWRFYVRPEDLVVKHGWDRKDGPAVHDYEIPLLRIVNFVARLEKLPSASEDTIAIRS